MRTASRRTYWVYILASRRRVLYVGMTSNLARRVWEHRTRYRPGFTARYNVDRLVYFEDTGDVTSAIARERELKGWRRARKIALIESQNPAWHDLGSVLLP